MISNRIIFCICATALVSLPLSDPSIGMRSALSQSVHYGTDLNPSLSLSSAQAGKTPSHRLDFSISAGGLETYIAEVRYPLEFAFAGFAAVGPLHSKVGLLGLDFNADGNIDVSYALRSSGPSDA